jgi:hypothetical protein
MMVSQEILDFLALLVRMVQKVVREKRGKWALKA